MAQNLPPIINLTKDGGVQRRPVQRAPQNIPPPPFHAVPQDLRTFGLPPNGPPQGMRPQNYQSTQMPQPHFPSPPMQAVPRDLHPPQPPAMKPVDIVDIRSEGLTPAEARERLSSYIIVRIERMGNFHDDDQLDIPKKSNWQRAKHSYLNDITQQEAQLRVSALQQEGKSVGEKKASLSIPVQRQLEFAKDSLERSETDRRFQYNLMQFDQKLKRIDYGELEYSSKHNKKSKKSWSYSTSKKSKKPKYERVAITAYFKRTPKSGHEALHMLEEQERERNMRVVPQVQRPAPVRENAPAFNQSAPTNPQQAMPQKPVQVMQVNMDPPKQPPMMQPQKADFPKAPQGMPPQKDLPKPPQGKPPQVQPSQGKPPQDMQQQKTDPPRNPQIILHKTEVQKQPNPMQDKNFEKHGKGPNKATQPPLNIQFVKPGNTDKHIVGSPGSSRDSFHSTSSTISDTSTSVSSLDSSSGPPKRRRGRSRTPAYRTDRANFGVTVPARRQSRHEERDYILEDVPPKYAKTPSVPMPTSSRGSIRDSPYPSVHERHIGYDSRTAPAPRILQLSSGIRRGLTSDEVRREVLEDEVEKTEDRIQRMHLYQRSLKEELEALPYTERHAAEYMKGRAQEYSSPRERWGIRRNF